MAPTQVALIRMTLIWMIFSQMNAGIVIGWCPRHLRWEAGRP